MTSDLPAIVRDAQNDDGGWGYYVGKASRLEPTCWALLARSGDDEERGVQRLRTWPVREGLLLERVGGTVNVAFHAVALSVLSLLDIEHVEGNASLAAALEGVRGLKMKRSEIVQQDNTLQGWPWAADTFSWVEPTGWSVLALTLWARRAGRVAPQRVDEGVRLLIDRVCRTGGWNYGNSNMLGSSLHPHVPTSAIGLLALQRHRTDAAVQRSLEWLEAHALSEPSGMTLALACLALHAYNRPVAAVRAALEARVHITVSLGNQCGVAAAACALDDVGRPALFAL